MTREIVLGVRLNAYEDRLTAASAEKLHMGKGELIRLLLREKAQQLGVALDNASIGNRQTEEAQRAAA